jgi:hypothetical protein
MNRILSSAAIVLSSALSVCAAPVFDFKTKTVRLNSGYEMPIVGLGTYSLSHKECLVSISALLEAGGRLIVGEAFRSFLAPAIPSTFRKTWTFSAST